MRNLKNNKNLSVDVREYFQDAQEGSDFKIPIEQNHGKTRRGVSKDQLNSNPQDLNLLFYNFHSGSEDRDGQIMEEQEEFEDDFSLGPTNCKSYHLNFRCGSHWPELSPVWGYKVPEWYQFW